MKANVCIATPCVWFERGSRAGGRQGKRKPPALPGFRLIRETSAAQRRASYCEAGATHPTAGVGDPSGRP